MARLCLNSIVKNEAARIARMLDSVAPFVECYVILDTGSTDGTPELIEKIMAGHGIPGNVVRGEFKDFSQARNDALRSARAYAADKADYLLLVDADMELQVKDAACFDMLGGNAPAYDMYQFGGTLYYLNRRLVKVNDFTEYRGVTHEYLDAATGGCIPINAAFFIDHADGANRPDKFKRDIQLLRAGLKKEPNNARYFFYLAQSYRDARQFEKAILWYRRRIAASGWDEETWYSQYSLAHCMKELKDEAGFIREMLIAYNMRPSRVESLYDLAHHYRNKGENALATLFTHEGMTMRRTGDALFVNDYAYAVGCQEEFSIAGFYGPRRDEAFAVTDRLSLLSTPYHNVRSLARANMFHYLVPLATRLKSFKLLPIAFDPPDDWTPLNPSIVNHKGTLLSIIRTVNYKINEHGQYIIRATDGTANAENPINTRNYLVEFDAATMHPVSQTELLPPGNMPCEFPLVVGFEDMRLFSWDDELWTSSTVRQIDRDGNCEQVLARVIHNGHLTDIKRMLRQPRQTQKNWMPIIGTGRRVFMYRLLHIVDDDGNDVQVLPTGQETQHISGGSQVIPFMGGYLCIVHEAHPLPGSGLRYYLHRFVWFERNFERCKIGKPFVFEDRAIEFCAGLAWHPDGKRLVISYGFKDAAARFATIEAHELWVEMGHSGSLLW